MQIMQSLDEEKQEAFEGFSFVNEEHVLEEPPFVNEENVQPSVEKKEEETPPMPLSFVPYKVDASERKGLLRLIN